MLKIFNLKASARKDDFDSIVTVHQDSIQICSWNFEKQRFSKFNYTDKRIPANSTATCIKISPCGHFVYIGYSSGHIAKYNLESGHFRGLFGGKTAAHKETVTSIDCDTYSRLFFSSSADKTVAFWNSDTFECISRLNISVRPEKLRFCPEKYFFIIL